jgi:GT2 family glycosyltransferase
LAELSTSVIVASYGRPEPLLRCLKALTCQTILPSEVIVVWQADDYPTKQSAETFDAPYPIRTVHCAETGIVAAENAGLNSATGDIMFLLDDDAIAQPFWLSRHLSYYADPKVGAVGGSSINFRPDGTRKPSRTHWPVAQLKWYGRFVGNAFDHPTEWSTRPVMRVHHLVGNNMSLRRKAFDCFESGLKSYWQLFEADACLQVTQNGYEILFDFGNPILHFPTNTVFDPSREGDLNRKIYHWAYNHAFILSKFSPGSLRLPRLAYLFLVGSTAHPGILFAGAAMLKHGHPAREIGILFKTLRWKARGWRDGAERRIKAVSLEAPKYLRHSQGEPE